MSNISLVKLKMKTIYKSFLSLIGLLIILTSAVGVMYLFYDKVIDADGDIEVNGALSINYMSGKKFNVDNNSQTIEFSVSNAGDSVSYYNIGFAKIRGEGTYKILYNDNEILSGNLQTTDEVTSEYISIDAKETKIYTLELSSDSHLKGELNVRIQNNHLVTFADTIIKNNPPVLDSQTKVGSEVATANEGLIKSSDDIGVSYYFRGNILNNYVSFADRLWRIVRINGDGTVRLVLNDATDVLASYYDDDNTKFEFETSAINTYLEEWLDDNLTNYLNYITTSKYCSDISHDDAYNYTANIRIMTNQIPTLNCLGTVVNNNIGLMTIDEVILAGASPKDNNKNYYLYNSNIKDSWYTMSAAKGSENSINMFMVSSSGGIELNVVGNLYRNVRPVITLIKNIEMQGTGTIEDPYRLDD